MGRRAAHNGITPGEREVVELLAQGKRNNEIARILSISERATEERIKNAMGQLGAVTRHQLLYIWGQKEPRKRIPLLDTRESLTHRCVIYSAHGDVQLYITTGYYPTGEIGEIFTNVGKQGSTIRGVLDSWARMVSVSLQWGVPPVEIIRKFSGIAFEPSGPTDNPNIPTCSSLIDYVAKWLDLQEKK